MVSRSPLALSAAVLLVGCGLATQSSPPLQEEPPAAPLAAQNDPTDSSAVMRETKNVTYEGIVRPAGISIYQEGSHRLQLDDGRFMLLESDTADLNGYVGERVEVFGALRPTVENGGMIIRVEAISLLTEESPLEEPTGTGMLLGNTEEGTGTSATGSVEIPEEDTPAEGDPPTEDPAPATEEEDTATEPTELPAEVVVSPALSARIEQMASESFGADQWTQQYCTAHIGFCIPVHRNWWFKSFGTTTSMLWHVEMSSAEIDSLFDGPIRVNLVSGTIGAERAADGQVREEQDGTVVGFRSWIDNRHFEISAPAPLSDAVQYITQHLEEYAGE